MMMRAWWYLRADSCCYSSTVWSLLFVGIPCDSASSHANLPAREVLASFLLRIRYHQLEKHVAFLLDLVVGDWFNASSTWLSFTISGLGGSNRIPCSSCGIVGQTRTYCSNSEAYRYAELIATGDLDSLRLVLFRSRRFVLLACGVLTTRPTFSLPAVANQLLLRVYMWPRDELRRSITLRLIFWPYESWTRCLVQRYSRGSIRTRTAGVWYSLAVVADT